MPDRSLEPLARELARARDEESAPLEDRLRGEALSYGAWVQDLIEEGSISQMEGAMRLPVSVGVSLIGGSVHEAPMAYKNIETIVGLQDDLVELVGRFTPKIVRMDAGGKPWGKKKRRQVF